MEPLDRSTIWPYDERGEPGQFYYSRYGSPTVAEAEARLGELDGGEALLFPSGSGAATALALSLLKPGDTVALAEGCYFGTGVTFQALAKWGLRYVEFDQTGEPPDGVQLVWLEAPSNPFLTMPDLEAAADPAWLLLRGLKTLEVRVRRQTETASALAERLRGHPKVRIVRYAGIGGLLSFDVADGDAARRVETSTRLIVNATSLGGVTSVMESRHRWEGDRVPTGLLRLSAGLEDPDALWNDLAAALERA